MSDETTLLSCPFCGCKASVKVLEYDDNCKVWGVFCESDLQSEYSHGHFVDNYPTEAEAIAAWNARAEPPYDELIRDMWKDLVSLQGGYEELGYQTSLPEFAERMREMGIEVGE